MIAYVEKPVRDEASGCRVVGAPTDDVVAVRGLSSLELGLTGASDVFG